MNNPYLILGLWEQRENLSDKQVQEAYLNLVKQYTPDRSPLRFQQIKKAYEQLKTTKKRLEYFLFNTTLADRDDLIAALLPENKLKRPEMQLIQKVLK